MLSPPGQILASASTSKLWPRPWPQTFGLDLVCNRTTSSQEETDQSVCQLHVLEGTCSYCARENEKLNCVVLIIII